MNKIDLSLPTIGNLFFQQIKSITFKSCGIKEENMFDFQINKRWPI